MELDSYGSQKQLMPFSVLLRSDFMMVSLEALSFPNGEPGSAKSPSPGYAVHSPVVCISGTTEFCCSVVATSVELQIKRHRLGSFRACGPGL